MIEEAGKHLALRRGDWKYIPGAPGGSWQRIPREPTLFNLSIDPGEQRNLAETYPEITTSMARQLEQLVAGDGLRHETY